MGFITVSISLMFVIRFINEQIFVRDSFFHSRKKKKTKVREGI